MTNRHFLLFILLITCVFYTRAEKAIDYFNSAFFSEKILYNYYEDVVIDRINGMNTIVDHNTDSDVLDQVKRYIINDRNGSRSILKNGEVYFPLIEKILQENNLPSQLRNLAALESALNPRAQSYAGAAGLWQLMPETGRNNGLIVNKTIDERLDPVASTKAAAIYLNKLFELFGDWNLVLAAYNCGEYKIKNLLEENNTNSYHVIKKFLPKQTQLFIPTFLGVSYMLEYYNEHNILPVESDVYLENITFIKIDRAVNLGKLFKKTHITKELFRTYNASIKQNTISPLNKGLYIGLPDSMMVSFVEYYLEAHKEKVDIDNNQESLYRKLISEVISFSRPFQPPPPEVKFKRQATVDYKSLDYANIKDKPVANVENFKNYQYHLVRIGESLSEIANLYTNVGLNDLMEWNQLTENDEIRPGRVVLIKK
ncbi:MAG: transglycosylase SLT domain-containing protein [Saprospiraceae bacterium]|nr:transglycosylase SLT domain-containing protein [Saprospiraceae bacterium]